MLILIHINERSLRDACNEGHFEVVKLLVNHGAIIHVNNDACLNKLVKKEHFNILTWLLIKIDKKKYFDLYSVTLPNRYKQEILNHLL